MVEKRLKKGTTKSKQGEDKGGGNKETSRREKRGRRGRGEGEGPH